MPANSVPEGGEIWFADLNPERGHEEAVRSICKDRLLNRWGTVATATMEKVEDRLRMLLGL